MKKSMWLLCAGLIVLLGVPAFAGDEGAAPAEGEGDPPAEKPVDRKALQKELRTTMGALNKVTRTLTPLIAKIDEDPEVAELKKAYEDKVREKLAAEGEDKAGLLDKKIELEKKKAELSAQLWKKKPARKPRKKPAKKPAGEKKPKPKKDKPPKKKKDDGGDGGGDAGGDAGGGDAGGGDAGGWGDGW
jgi:hypothetical protein